MSGPPRRNSSNQRPRERESAASYSPRAYHSPSCAISTLGAGSQPTCNTSWHLALHSYSHSVYGQWCQEQLWERVLNSYHRSLLWTGYKGLTYGLRALLLIQPISRPSLIVILITCISGQNRAMEPIHPLCPTHQSSPSRYQDCYMWSSANNVGGSLTS